MRPQCMPGIRKVLANLVKDALAVVFCREQSFHVLHDKDSRRKTVNNLQVLSVQSAAMIRFDTVAFDTLVTGSAGKRVCLAGRAADQRPGPGSLGESALNRLVNFAVLRAERE